jgi:hypothetical protein
MEHAAPKFTNIAKNVSREDIELLQQDLADVLNNVAQLDGVVDGLREGCESKRRMQQDLAERLRLLTDEHAAVVERMAALVTHAGTSVNLVEDELAALDSKLRAVQEQNAFFAVQLQSAADNRLQRAAGALGGDANVAGDGEEMSNGPGIRYDVLVAGGSSAAEEKSSLQPATATTTTLALPTSLGSRRVTAEAAAVPVNLRKGGTEGVVSPKYVVRTRF